MASTKDLKKRIGTVKNTQQTTRAMKMVSAAKLRRAQEAIQAQRPYAHRVGALIKQLSSLTDSPIDSPLVKKADLSGADGEPAPKKILLVLVTSDRGLCGGFNANVIKTTQRWIVANAKNYETITLGFVGRKAYDYFKTKKVTMGPYYPELGGKVSLAKAKKLADALTEIFVSGQVDEVKFIFNEFRNAVTQVVTVDHFLPLEPLKAAETGSKAVLEESLIYIVKPSPREVLEQLIAKHFTIQAFRIMLESQASEHGSRMSAMENATKNAGEMMKKLTLQYNRQRQANITKELLEIIAGSESQKSAS